MRTRFIVCMQARGLSNVRVITADINQFEAPSNDYDRVISIEVRLEAHAWFLLYECRTDSI